jgi:rare lipoprotein A
VARSSWAGVATGDENFSALEQAIGSLNGLEEQHNTAGWHPTTQAWGLLVANGVWMKFSRSQKLTAALIAFGVGFAPSCRHSPSNTPAPVPPPPPVEQPVVAGVASFYGPGFHGRLTANGERYDQHGLTAAHRSLPFGTCLRVVNLENEHAVEVRVNDRGPYVNGRVLDLSVGAAKQIRMVKSGVTRVRAFPCDPARLKVRAVAKVMKPPRSHHAKKHHPHRTSKEHVARRTRH